MNDVVQWIQSLNGIFIMTFGGLSFTAVAGVIFNLIKARKDKHVLSNLSNVLENSTKESEELKEALEEQKEENILLKAEQKSKDQDNAEIQNLLLNAVSIIIAQSSGISSADKISFMNSVKEAQEKIEKRAELLEEEILSSVEKAKEFIKTKKEKAEKIKQDVKSTVDNVKTLIEKYTKA